MKLLLLSLALTLPATAQTPATPTPQPPDTILFHGNILTGAHLTPNDPSPTPARVTALAIRSGRILAVGNDPDILALQSPQTILIDLHGGFAMPGFNDAHTHIASAGQQHLTLDLDNVPSLADMKSRIATYAATLPPGQAPAASQTWLLGGGWDHTKWPSHKLPTKEDLDAVTAGHPTLLLRTDGHIAVANSAALLAAGITATTPAPPGSQIDHDALGSLTGILREQPALTLVQSHIPPPSSDTRRKALQLSIDDALTHGVTSVQDFSDWDDWLVLESLEHTHKLPLRVSEWIDFNLPLPVLDSRRASHDPDDPLLHLGMLKGFMDGSLGSRTAALEDPYADDPANSGIPRYDQQKLNQLAAARAADGFQLGFHAIGDLANSMALNALSAAGQVAHPAPLKNPDATIITTPASLPIDPRFRIEHAQVLLPADLQRFHDLHIIASMQPSHLLTDMAWAPARLGPTRVKYAYAWKSFLDHGVTLAFGTDYPVESINPFRGLYAAITRQNEAGTQTFQPQEKLTINQAIYAYTQASAFAEFREHLKGRLEPNFLADIILLDRDITSDITTATPQQLLRTKVLRTIVDGNTVYQSPQP